MDYGYLFNFQWSDWHTYVVAFILVAVGAVIGWAAKGSW